MNRWKSLTEELGPTFARNAVARDEGDLFVAEHYPLLRERGLTSMLIPAELGGGGASHGETCHTLRLLAHHDPSTALALSMHQHLVAAQVFNHRRGQARATATLEKVAAQRLVLVSTGARDWLDSNGRMERVEGGYRVTAVKAFASGSPAGDLAITSAPYEHPEQGSQVLHFAVPMKAKGVRLGDDWMAHGMRSTGSHSIHLESVFVPDDAITLTRPRGKFHPVWSVVLTVAMPLICSVYVGVAQRAAEIARGLARRRSEDPAVLAATGEMETARVTAESLLEAMIAAASDLSFEPSPELASRIVALKTGVVTAAKRCVELTFEAAGGAAFYRETGLEKLLRDVRAGDFHPLQPGAQRLFTGRVALGLDPA